MPTTLLRQGRWLAVLLACIAASIPDRLARAEPYLAMFEGQQCSSCHTSPSGGGKRTAFGNAYAQSQLAARRLGSPDAGLWTGEVSRWLAVGADLRADYRYTEVPGAATRSEFAVQRGTAYVEARLVEDRLSLYVDQQFAPGSSLNREAWLRLEGGDGKLGLRAGQFFLPYGLRFQDDSAFVRRVTGTNFTNPDRGLEATWESGPWLTQLALTNGSGGGTETDTGKQATWTGQYVRDSWRLGASASLNDADAGDRQMQALFAGLRTGPVAWLGEIDLIRDDLTGGGELTGIAGYVEANWRLRRGHNLKFAYDYFDPNDDQDEDHEVRWSALWEYTPIQFLQVRVGARIYDGPPLDTFANRDEFFGELHAFF